MAEWPSSAFHEEAASHEERRLGRLDSPSSRFSKEKEAVALVTLTLRSANLTYSGQFGCR